MRIDPKSITVRYDCILVWGHGLKYIESILNDFLLEKVFEVFCIKRHRPSNIKTFVKEMYSYDYAPFWHLKSKTKYLLKTPQEVCFIFFRNFNPCEDYLGEGAFRHKESTTLKDFKERLRDKYNPYENGVRTHHHVIHATDSQEQTEHILKYLGYKQGVRYFECENKFVDLPYYLKGYEKFAFKSVDVSDLYCNIIEGESWSNYSSKIAHITESPQYRGLAEEMGIYEKYISTYLGGPLKDNYNIERYKKVYEGFEYLKEPYHNSFVIVEQKEGKYIILDGLHRASAHAYQGNKRIRICQISK